MARRFTQWVLAISAAISLCQHAAAQEILPLKPGKAWKHKHSGIGVPATLAGVPRINGVAYVADDLDVGLSFSVGNDEESVTFYIFRNTNGSVPVWFAQAQWGIENRNNLGSSTIAIAPQAFVPPGQSTASGLKVIYKPGKGPYLSTGLLLLPVGDWYVKLRVSSVTRSPAELEMWMDAMLAEIRWPEKVAANPIATPVSACSAPLDFPTEAKDSPKNGSADLMNGMLAMMMAQGKVKPTAQSVSALASANWCRDWSGSDNMASYRHNADGERYLLAIGDNGNGIHVGPDAGAALMSETDKDQPAVSRFAITLVTASQSINFVAQDRLPSPARVIDLLNANRVTTTVPTWGKKGSININSSGL